MKWEKHSKHPLYETCTEYSFPVLVRLEPSPNGKYLFQVNKLYGYAPSVELAKSEAEELVMIKLMEQQ